MFPIQEGCNTCTCLTNGALGCTANTCEEVSCRYRGATYQPGDTIDTGSSCSLCMCDQNGYVACRTVRRCEQQCHYKGRRYSHGVAIFDHKTCEVCRCFRGSMSCFDDMAERLARCRRPRTHCSSKAGKVYAVNEAFTEEDGCTFCVCRPGGYITCSKHRCPKDFCAVGNKTLGIGQSTLVRQQSAFSGQSQCAMCRCDEEAQLHCDRNHIKCVRSPTEGVCVYKNRLYYKARPFLETSGKGMCRQCLCNPNGIVSCSKRAHTCPAETHTCSHLGQVYVSGDVFIETSYNYFSRDFHTEDDKHDPSQPTTSTPKDSLLQYLNEKLNKAFGHIPGATKATGARPGPIQVTKKMVSKANPTGGVLGVTLGTSYTNCRLCTCAEDGKVDCKASKCRVRTCTYRNKTFYSGQNFTTSDGCKVCVCTDTGSVSCGTSKCNVKMAQRSSSSEAAATTRETSSGGCVYQGRGFREADRFEVREKGRCLACLCTKFGKTQCRDTGCQSGSSKNSSCNYVFFGMFISTLKACNLVE